MHPHPAEMSEVFADRVWRTKPQNQILTQNAKLARGCCARRRGLVVVGSPRTLGADKAWRT